MCGIVGFAGAQPAAPILLDGLKKLEYRGYDSAGIAVQDGGLISVVKTRGVIKNLCDKTDNGSTLSEVVFERGMQDAECEMATSKFGSGIYTLQVIQNDVVKNVRLVVMP